MKKTLTILSLLTLAGASALAQQNTLNTTTLSTAITSTGAAPNSTTTVVLASTTNVVAPSPAAGTAGSLLFIDGEAMQVLSIPVSGTVIVQRGAASTRVTAHAASVLVWIGNGDWYNSTPPSTPPRSTCTASALYASPDIHLLDGNWYTCDTKGLWGYAGPYDTDGQSRYSETGIGDAAYTALVTDRFIYFTALTATRLITLPAAASVPGKVITIKDTGGLASASILIELATVDGSATFECADLAYGGCTVMSNGTAWTAISAIGTPSPL